MTDATKEYMEGEERASAEEAGLERPSPFSNPYDQQDDQEKHYEFQCGYNSYIANRSKRQAAEREKGSWYDDDDMP